MYGKLSVTLQNEYKALISILTQQIMQWYTHESKLTMLL